MRKKKFNIKFWRKHGKLRRSGDLWTGGLLPPIATKADPRHRNRPLQRWRACHTKSNTKGDRESKKKNKQICQIFAKNNLKITADANKKVVNFLDVTPDLNTERFKPYSKPPTSSALRSQPIEPPTRTGGYLALRDVFIQWMYTHTLATHKERSAITFWKGKRSSKGLNLNKKWRKTLKGTHRRVFWRRRRKSTVR